MARGFCGPAAWVCTTDAATNFFPRSGQVLSMWQGTRENPTPWMKLPFIGTYLRLVQSMFCPATLSRVSVFAAAAGVLSYSFGPVLGRFQAAAGEVPACCAKSLTRAKVLNKSFEAVPRHGWVYLGSGMSGGFHVGLKTNALGQFWWCPWR